MFHTTTGARAIGMLVRLAVLAVVPAACSEPAAGTDGTDASTTDASVADGGDGCTDLLTVPVRVHLLRSDVASLDADLPESELPRLFAAVDEIWAQACIHFELESTITETVSADGAAQFEAATDMMMVADALTALLPRDAMLDPGVNVFVIRDLGSLRAGGRYFEPLDSVVWSDTRMDGSRTSPAILAHELGHSLSLTHYDGPGFEQNLMQAGGPGVDISMSRELTADQVAAARAQAATGDAF